MKVLLKNPTTEKVYEYNSSTAYYLLLQFVPMFGEVLSLVFIILRKQFRGISLNKLIYIFGFILLNMILIAMFGATSSSLLITVIGVLYFAFLILRIVMYISYVLNANYYSIKQRLEEGCIVLNEEEPEVKAAVIKAQSIKKPFWQITKF